MSARTQEIFVYKDEDMARITELKRIADTAIRSQQFKDTGGTARIGDAVTPEVAEADLRAFAEEASGRAQRVLLGDIGSRRWRTLLAQHRPRFVRRMVDGEMQDVIDEQDAGYNVNMETFVEALLSYVDPNSTAVRTILEPEFPTPQARTEWLDSLSGGDFDKIFIAAYLLNGRQALDPKELLDSLSGSPSLISTWE